MESKLLKVRKEVIDHNVREISSKQFHYPEFIGGYIAACTSITILFPLNKIIFRQILDGISFRQAIVQIKSDGLSNFYRGLLPPLLQKSASYSIMFGTQHEYYLLFKKHCENSNSEFIKSMNSFRRDLLITGLSACFAGLTEATLTPFERVQAVLQMQKFHDSYRHTWHVFEEISKSHGIKELYRGLSAICIRNSLSNVIFFTIRQPLKASFPNTNSKLKNTLYDFLSGGILGAFISTLFYPLNVVKSHMQAKVGGDFANIYQTFRIVFESRDRNINMLFKGIGSNFTRAILSWGFTNAAYELVLSTFR